MGTVLVVEDDLANARLLETVLGWDGHRVLRAGDGVSALDLARREAPDLILLDVSLPGSMNGLDVCRALRADPATATTAVLIVSGRAYDHDLEAGRAAGADGYLTKPFMGNEFRTRVGELLDRANASAPSRADPAAG